MAGGGERVLGPLKVSGGSACFFYCDGIFDHSLQ